MEQRATRITVAVVKLGAEAEPRLSLTLYEAATDQSPADLVFGLVGRETPPFAGEPVSQNIIGRTR